MGLVHYRPHIKPTAVKAHLYSSSEHQPKIHRSWILGKNEALHTMHSLCPGSRFVNMPVSYETDNQVVEAVSNLDSWIGARIAEKNPKHIVNTRVHAQGTVSFFISFHPILANIK